MTINKRVLAVTALLMVGCAQWSWAQGQTVTFRFSQSGFGSGGSVSGFFRGTDLDGDGRIYAASSAVAQFTGLPFGNELDYAEVTFSGFGDQPGPTTVVYDKSVEDMESPRNTFMALAYNIDGGPWGDDPDEGASLAIFSPSTNYNMGQAFRAVFDPSPGTDQPVGACGSGQACGLVISFVPDDTADIGAVVSFQDFSSTPVTGNVVAPRQAQPVPLSPALSALIAAALAAFGALVLRRRTLSGVA